MIQPGLYRVDCFDTVIVGGGPAGLMCAIRCGTPGKSVLLIEKKGNCGNKLLIAGSGQCNITHDGDIAGFPARYGSGGAFLKPALYQFPNRAVMEFFRDRGVPVSADNHGKVFPESRRSQDILDCLLREAARAGAVIRTGDPVARIRHDGHGFTVTTVKTECRARAVVIATGGMSYPGTGSSGDGYAFAASLGHTIRTPAPALTPVTITDYPFSGCAGISFPGMAFSIWRDGKRVARCRGDVLFTHTGLSGPGILDNSRLMQAGDVLRLSFADARDPGEYLREVSERIRSSGKRGLVTALVSGRLPVRFVRALCGTAGVAPDTPCSQVTAPERGRIVSALTDFPVTVATPGDFSVAMVTTGGVDLPEVDRKTMESRLVRGLYFAGEVLDIDGDTGGYNLQAAFSTGFLAGSSIRKRRETDG